MRVASLNLTASTISWKDTIGKWFNTQSDSSTVRQHGDALQRFFKKYVPATMDFIQPALLTNSSNSFATVSTSTVSDGLGSLTLEPQQLKLSEVHVVQSCCRILQVHVDKRTVYICTKFNMHDSKVRFLATILSMHFKKRRVVWLT